MQSAYISVPVRTKGSVLLRIVFIKKGVAILCLFLYLDLAMLDNIQPKTNMKTLSISQIVASRIYSFVYDSEVTMLKGGTKGTPPNPLLGCRVVKHATYAGQAASAKMYVNAWEKLNPGQTYHADNSRKPSWEPTLHPCIVRNVDTGALLIRILNPRQTSVRFTVDGKPATFDQRLTIEDYTKARSPRKENSVSIMFPYLDNLLNVVE